MINIKTNSRRIQPGDTFVALRGIHSDGHDYIEDAIERGAKKIIAEKGTYSVKTEIVKDTRAYLNKYLADNYNPILNEIQIIGITGTNGKSTVAYLLYQALNKLGKKSAYIGTLGFYVDKKIEDLPNSTPDICDNYEMLINAYDLGCKFVIMEISSHALINGRVETIKFDHAIFTNLTQDHLDFHITMEKYVQAKQLLFKKLKPNGVAIVNLDDNYSRNFLFPSNHNITYGFNGGDFKLTDYKMDLNGTVFNFVYHNDTYQVYSKLIGKFNIYNMMSSIIFLLCLGVEPIKMLKVINELEAPAGRLELIKHNNNLIVVDYAHTPDAIINVIDVAKEFTKGNIYIVFGCTGERDRGKRPIMTNIVSKEAKFFIITEDDLYYEDFNQITNDMLLNKTYDNYEIIEDRKEAIIKGISLLEENDTLLILGKGHETIMKIREKRIPFNDKNVVIDYLNSIQNQ